MGLTVDLGRRIELVPMDPHFHDISIAFYKQDRESGLEFIVHTYSQREGAAERLEFIASAMAILGGMERLPGNLQRLHFPPGRNLPLAARRVFLEACKCPQASEVKARPLNIFDKKTQSQVRVASLGEGLYQVKMETDSENASKRAAAIAAGIAKLSGASVVEGQSQQVAFPDGKSADTLVGLLLVRALNVRAIVREQEAAASRGVLSAPSAQKE